MAIRDVAINLLTKLQDKGFKDLEKSTKKSNKLLDGLGKKLLAVFSVTAITAYGKAAVKAFLEEEKAVRRLNVALENTAQGFKALAAEDFISNLQRTARVADDELRPALTTLINAGIDFEQSQKLLKTALDVSAGSGKDLQSVTVGLSRAFRGNNAALSGLNLGLTQAQLKAASFDDIIALVTAKFSGQADAAAQTYAGRLAAVNNAADEASETIGQGLVKALDLAAGSSAGAETALAGVSSKLSEIFVGVGAIVGETRSGGLPGYFDLVKKAAQAAVRNGLNPFAAALDFFTGKGKDALSVTPTQLDLVKKSIEAQKRAADLQKALATINAKIQKDTKKSDAEKKRSDAVQKLRKTIQYKFDIEAINQQAALRRNLSASDKDRLLQLIALKTSDYQDDEEAIKTLTAATKGRYDEAMALEGMYALLKAAGFAADKLAIEGLTKLDPKITFSDNLEDIRKALEAIINGKYTVGINFSLVGADAAAAAAAAKAGADAAAADAAAKAAAAAAADAAAKAGADAAAKAAALIAAQKAIDAAADAAARAAATAAAKIAADAAAAAAAARAAATASVTPSLIAADESGTIGAASIAAQIAAAEAASKLGKPSLIAAQESGTIGAASIAASLGGAPGVFDPARFRARDEGVTINVNVSGSVIAQNDLVQTITDAVYQSQRTGNPLLLGAV